MARTRLIALLLAAGLAGACAGHVPAVPSVPMEAALERATAASRASLGESLRAGLQGPGTFGTGQPGGPGARRRPTCGACGCRRTRTPRAS